MAKRKREIAPENATETAAENGAPPQEEKSFAEKLREEVQGLQARHELMERVELFIRETIKQTGLKYEDRMGKIVDGLADMGLPDEEISYLMEPKPGASDDGREYIGYTFAERNHVKNTLTGKKALLTRVEGRGGHAAAVESRRAEGQEHGIG